MNEFGRGPTEAEKNWKRFNDTLKQRIFPPENQPLHEELLFDTFNPVIDRMNLLHADKRLELSPEEFAEIKEELEDALSEYEWIEEDLLNHSHSVLSKLKRGLLPLVVPMIVGIPGVQLVKEFINQQNREEVTEEQEDLEDELHDLVGNEIVFRINALGDHEEGESVSSLVIEGFENSTRVPGNKYMIAALQPLPDSYEAEVTRVSYKKDETPDTDTAYGLGDGWVVLAHTDREGTITFFNGNEQREAFDTVSSTLNHEVAHNVDWLGNKSMTTLQRFRFFKLTIDRVQSDNRVRDKYVESIHNDDPQKELLSKTTEYWAVVNELYFSLDYHLLPEEDSYLVESVLKIIDPQFNPKSDRDKVVNGQVDVSVAIDLDHDLRKLPQTDEVRAALADTSLERKVDELNKVRDELIAKMSE